MTANVQVTRIILWCARGLSIPVLGFIAFFLLAELFEGSEFGDGLKSSREVITFICFPISTIIGLALAWKKELIGGLICIAGLALLFFLQPSLLSNTYFLLMTIPAILFVFYGVNNKKGRS